MLPFRVTAVPSVPSGVSAVAIRGVIWAWLTPSHRRRRRPPLRSTSGMEHEGGDTRWCRRMALLLFPISREARRSAWGGHTADYNQLLINKNGAQKKGS